jgi:ABC-type Fe3+ transport system permease subunit
LVQAGGETTVGGKLVWGVGLMIAIALAVISPLASTHPDGLEWVAGQQGFLNLAQGPLYKIIPDYIFPGVHNEALATILAGILGTLIVFGVALGVAFARRKRSAS